jgi:hypothetical protein
MNWDSVFMYLLFIWFFWGDGIKNFILTLVNRRDLQRLTRKEEKALRKEVEEKQRALTLSTDILHRVYEADEAYPQLPITVREDVDSFLDVRRPQSGLSLDKGKPKKN